MKTFTTSEGEHRFISRTNDPNEYLQFQKAFYRAFEDIGAQVLLRQIWEWDDEAKTISLRIPEEYEWVFAWAPSEEPLAYAAASFGGESCFSQVRHYGFELPDKYASHVEVMTLFRGRATFSGSMNTHFLEKLCYPFLRERGYAWIISTCADRVLPLYKRWGWENPAKREIMGVNRHLICKKL